MFMRTACAPENTRICRVSKVVVNCFGEPVADALPVAPPDPPVARRGSWAYSPPSRRHRDLAGHGDSQVMIFVRHEKGRRRGCIRCARVAH
jgi:hypothetical protein